MSIASWMKKEDGAALLSVLLLVAVMSAAAVVTFETLMHTTRTASKGRMAAQAEAYAYAGELYGAEQVVKLADNADAAALLGADANAQQISFPIENGTVTGRLLERTNCFNLVSLVTQQENGLYTANALAQQQFTRFLQAYGLGPAEARSIAASVADWQDSDNRVEQAGAESYSYSALAVPYRTPNQPMNHVSELKLIKGMSAELYEVIRDTVCIDPVDMTTSINVNSLHLTEVPLLMALLGDEITYQEAERLIRDRPGYGYDHISGFWRTPVLEGVEVGAAIRSQIGLTPVRFEITVDVRLADARSYLTSMVHLDDTRGYTIVSREFGV